ncbi:hypothetical protein IJG78_02790 [Candidatus Saccharibacteria bacterium]|nr:hypothetical protein [Candidatus Saccharibacteria bacterium]
MTGKIKISDAEKQMRLEKKYLAEQDKRGYLTRKRKMVPYERKNYDKIALFQGTKGFYVIGGHSAIIMSELVAPDLGMKVVLRNDTDFECAFSEGLISVKDLDYYKLMVPKSKLVKQEYVEKDHSVVFFLKDPLAVEEYELLAHADEIKSTELLNMVSSSVVMPNLYKMIRDLMLAIYKAGEKTERLAQMTAVRALTEDAMKLERAFLLGARTTKAIDEALTEIEERAKDLLVDLKIVEDMGIWRTKQSWRIGSLTSRILTQIPIERKARKLKG